MCFELNPFYLNISNKENQIYPSRDKRRCMALFQCKEICTELWILVLG
jgi:hypothetical protein